MAKRKRARKQSGPEIDGRRHLFIAIVGILLCLGQGYFSVFGPTSIKDRIGYNAIAFAVAILIGTAILGREIARSRRQFTAAGAPMETAPVVHSVVALSLGLGLVAISALAHALLASPTVAVHHALTLADIAALFGQCGIVVSVALFDRTKLDGPMRVRIWFDSLIILLTVAAFSWFALSGQVITRDSHQLSTRVIECLFPVLDLTMFGALLAQTAQPSTPARIVVFRHLSAGVTLLCIANSITFYSRFVDNGTPSPYLNVVVVLGAFVLIRAASLEVSRIRHEPVAAPSSSFDTSPYRTPLWRNLLPVIMIPVAAVLIIEANQSGFSVVAMGSNICGALLVSLVAARQVFAFGENRTLYECLLDSHRGLENIVERRTRELHRSNKALLEEIQNRTHTEVQLRDAIRRAEDLAKAKSMFLANMSHEIRTPMNGVLGMIQLLAETPVNDEQTRYINTARQSTESLLRIIDDILNFSKIEAGKVTIEVIPTDVIKLSEEVLELMQPAASNRQIELRLEVRPGVSRSIGLDPVRIRQVLMNLTGNAVKFTEKGSVTIVIEPAQENGRLRFEVRDTGIGIPEDRQAAIFESFTQVDGTTTRKFGGTGLGTTISKQLVELMEGQIGLRSALGLGSTFWFEIPCEPMEGASSGEVVGPTGHTFSLIPVQHRPEVKPIEVAKQIEETPVETGPYVLVVEDNPVNQMVAKNMLKKVGARIETAMDGSEAIDLVFEADYDLVLMDVQMPVMGGIEATQLIREREFAEGRRRLPIIALTANAMDEDRQICLSAGMDDFLSKPVRKADLSALLERWWPRIEDLAA